jgi:5-methyltetrahydrofolate--homocysteine methyltransferase
LNSPGAGLSGRPEHTEKGDDLGAAGGGKRTGMKLTESLPRGPARRFPAGTSAIRTVNTSRGSANQRDQVEDYALRKGMSVAEVERWLAPNLGYDAD